MQMYTALPRHETFYIEIYSVNNLLSDVGLKLNLFFQIEIEIF